MKGCTLLTCTLRLSLRLLLLAPAVSYAALKHAKRLRKVLAVLIKYVVPRVVPSTHTILCRPLGLILHMFDVVRCSGIRAERTPRTSDGFCVFCCTHIEQCIVSACT